MGQRGDHKATVRAFRAIVEQDPEDSLTWNNLGVARMRYARQLVTDRKRSEGRDVFFEALVALREAIRLAPASAELPASNLRDVMGALERNFGDRPSEQDLAILEERGMEFKDDVMMEPDEEEEEEEEEEGDERGSHAANIPGPASVPRRPPTPMTKWGAWTQPPPAPIPPVQRSHKPSSTAATEAKVQEALNSLERPDVSLVRKARKALNLFTGVGHLSAPKEEIVKRYCIEENLRIPVPSDAAIEENPPVDVLQRAESGLVVCGVVVLESAFHDAIMDSVRLSSVGLLDGVMVKVSSFVTKRPGGTHCWQLSNAYENLFGKQLETMDARTDAKRRTFETVDMAKRDHKRYEFFNPLEPPFTNDSFIANGVVFPAIFRAMQGAMEIDTFSVVTALPGSPTQSWHRDAPPLLDDWEGHLPPHGIVQFVPLKDQSREMGPTEFIVGSHVVCSGDAVSYGELVDAPGLPLCPPAVSRSLDIFYTDAPRGSAILFDFRVVHRGGPNKHPHESRPLLYSTYFREWYVDTINFKAKHTRAFDEFDANTKKLLTRQDSRRYIAQVEDELRNRGVDVDGMQSKYLYEAVDFKQYKSDTGESLDSED